MTISKGIILITDGSRLVGNRLSEMLTSDHYEVRHLSRSPKPRAPYPTYKWNLKTGELDELSLINVDYIIHLAGANVSEKRWSNNRKEEITFSRVEPAQLL